MMQQNTKPVAMRIQAFLSKVRFFDALSTLLALLTFSFILFGQFPTIFGALSHKARISFAEFLPLFVLLIYASFRIPGRVGRFFSVTLTFSFFALALGGLWETGQSQSTVFNGIVPLFDASAYYSDALRLMAGQDLSSLSARRPLFAGLFAVLLTITNRNLMASLGILTAITAGACYLAAKEIQRTHGAEAATLALTILFLFHRHNNGLVMSESIGLALGALGFAIIWRGASEKKQTLLWTGIFVSTLALNARAGAFFVLPLLVLWGTWIFREQNTKLAWKFLIGDLVAIGAGFLLNWVVFRLLAGPTGILFANFSDTLYGLATGGNPWFYVLKVHPELLNLVEPYQSRAIYKLAFEQILQNPVMLLRGMLYNWTNFFTESGYGVYSYISGSNATINHVVLWGLYVLCGFGIWRWVRKPSDSLSSLVVVTALGVVLSVPFLPPTDTSLLRSYASSIIILALLPAIGLAFIVEKLNSRIGFLSKPDANFPGSRTTVGFALLLTLIMVGGPIIIKHLGSPPQLPAIACRTGSVSLLIHFDPGTYFNVLPDNSLIPNGMPNFHLLFYKGNSHSLADPNLINWAIKVKPSVTIFDALDYRSYENVLIISPSNLLPTPGGFLELCADRETDPAVAGYNIFHVRYINLILETGSR
jgi:hypothetical protein